jgi:hypothetical protein
LPQLKHKGLFGTDFPLISPDRWLKDFAAIDIGDDVRLLIFKENAVNLSKLCGEPQVRAACRAERPVLHSISSAFAAISKSTKTRGIP